MAISFQYNKTSLQALDKNLKVRVRALPTIKNKESALRVEVKKAKDRVASLQAELIAREEAYASLMPLWVEFDADLLRVEDVVLLEKKIAGVKVPLLQEVLFAQKPFSVFSAPKWLPDGIAFLKAQAEIGLQKEVSAQRLAILENARKKTTQKVNLFEKVQIPGYEDAIRKIKRFMEDEENLSKSAQKIVKGRRE